MTIHFPDVSHYQSGLRLDGAVAVIAKATQGTGYRDPAYAGFRAQAAALRIPFAAYHWLDTADADAQARNAFAVVGPDVPLMIDDEQNVINVAHTLEFVRAYRSLGGRVVLEYAPRWVWDRSGRPDLRPLAAASLSLVSSNYPAAGYTESGPGWTAYGGVTPTVWQYTSARVFNGQKVDFNAYRGSVADLRALLDAPSTIGDDMAINEIDFAALIWRVEALVNNRPVVLGGPTKGEVNKLAVAMQAAAGDPITDAQLAELVAAAKTAVSDALDGATATVTTTLHPAS